jgi:hypothetical protein
VARVSLLMLVSCGIKIIVRNGNNNHHGNHCL